MHELKTGSALPKNMNVVLLKLWNSTRSARSQISSNHYVFSKRSIENFMRLIRNLMPEAHGHIVSSGVTFFYSDKRFRQRTEMVGNVEADLERSKEWLSHMFEIENRVLIYTKNLTGVKP